MRRLRLARTERASSTDARCRAVDRAPYLAVVVALLASGCATGRVSSGNPGDSAATRPSAVEVGAVAVDAPGPVVAPHLSAYVRLAGGYGFSGVVRASSDRALIFEVAAGLADVGAERANTPTTMFEIASLAKQFTAAAVLKLEEDGLLSTRDSVGEHVEGLRPALASVTLHELLTHTSGLPWDLAPPQQPLPREEFLRLIRDAEPEYQPGLRFSYSNPGYSLLALVVEEVSGTAFDAFLRSRLLEPAGLTGTGPITGPLPGHPAARGYLGNQDRGYPWEAPDNLDGRPTWTSIGAGRMVSSAGDLDRWGEALLAGHVLSAASLEKLFGCHVETEPGGTECYGYGWNVERTDGRPLIWHDGSNGAFWARLTLDRESGLRLVVLSNKSLPPGWIVEANVRAALTGGELPVLPPAWVPLPPEVRAALVGSWDVDGGGRIDMVQVTDDLFLEPRDSAALALLSPTRPYDTARAAALTARARAVLDAASGGDWAPLHEHSSSDAAYSAIRQSLEHLRSIGPNAGGFEGFGVLGTTAGPLSPTAPLATYAFAAFGAGRAPLRLVWNNDTMSEVMGQTAQFVEPPRYGIRLTPDGVILGHSLPHERTITLQVLADGLLVLSIDGAEAIIRRSE